MPCNLYNLAEKKKKKKKKIKYLFLIILSYVLFICNQGRDRVLALVYTQNYE